MIRIQDFRGSRKFSGAFFLSHVEKVGKVSYRPRELELFFSTEKKSPRVAENSSISSHNLLGLLYDFTFNVNFIDTNTQPIHNGQKKSQEENPYGCQQPRDQRPRSRNRQRPEEHGYSNRRRRGRIVNQSISHRCSQSNGARHRQSSQGETGQQTARLRRHVRSLGRYTLDAVLEIRKWQHQPANGPHSPRPYNAFPS